MLTQKQYLLYESLRARGRYQGVPRRAPLWKQVLDATSGRGIRPYRRPGGGWIELEEFHAHVPLILRNYTSGFPPDQVASMLGLEDDQTLYMELDRIDPELSEADIESLVDEFDGFDVDFEEIQNFE